MDAHSYKYVGEAVIPLVYYIYGWEKKSLGQLYLVICQLVRNIKISLFWLSFIIHILCSFHVLVMLGFYTIII